MNRPANALASTLRPVAARTKPDEIADDIAGDEGGRSAEAVPENAGDEGGDAGPGRRDRGEIDRGEQDEGSRRHFALLGLRLASALSASTREEKNIAA